MAKATRMPFNSKGEFIARKTFTFESVEYLAGKPFPRLAGKVKGKDVDAMPLPDERTLLKLWKAGCIDHPMEQKKAG